MFPAGFVESSRRILYCEASDRAKFMMSSSFGLSPHKLIRESIHRRIIFTRAVSTSFSVCSVGFARIPHRGILTVWTSSSEVLKVELHLVNTLSNGEFLLLLVLAGDSVFLHAGGVTQVIVSVVFIFFGGGVLKLASSTSLFCCCFC